MKAKFENHYTRTEDLEKELYRYQLLESPRAITSYIIVGVVLILEIVLAFMANDMLYLCLAAIALCVFFIILTIYRYKKAMKLSRKRYEEMFNNGDYPEVGMILTGDELVMISSDRNTESRVAFRQFKKFFWTKNYYMIQTDAKLIYPFKKGAFTVGSELEFVAYVQNIIRYNKNSSKTLS